MFLADNDHMDDLHQASDSMEGDALAPPDGVTDLRGDLASLERDIDNLMSTGRPEKPEDNGGENRDQVDLLLKEINELLSHETNTLLTATNGLLGKALESIFDPKVLANKNEKIDKALAQALAKGRGGPPAPATKAPVTNPAPRFAGISRPMTADLSKTGLKPAAAPKVASGPRGALPTEEAPPTIIKTEEAPKGDTGAVTTRIEEKPPEPAPVAEKKPEPVAEQPPEPAPAPAPVAEKPPEPAPAPAPKPAEKPKAEAPAKQPAPAPAPADDADIPQPLILRILALPMRFVPQAARIPVSAAALTMLLSMPVAWALAERSASTVGIGPVDFAQLAAETAHEEEAAKAKQEASAKEKEKEKDAHGGGDAHGGDAKAGAKSGGKSSSKSSAKSSSKSSAKATAKPAEHGGGDAHH